MVSLKTLCRKIVYLLLITVRNPGSATYFFIKIWIFLSKYGTLEWNGLNKDHPLAWELRILARKHSCVHKLSEKKFQILKGFYNETIKDYFFNKYSHEICPNADFYTKISDDVFINPKIFWHNLETSIISQNIALSGCLDKEKPTERDPKSKNFVLEEWYNGHHSTYFTDGET